MDKEAPSLKTLTSAYSARILQSACTIPYSLPYSEYDEEYGILLRILRGILEWYSDGLRILCELTWRIRMRRGILTVFCGIFALLQNLVLSLRICSYSCVFLCVLDVLYCIVLC